MKFVILGRTAVIEDGKPVRLGAAKERGLLGLLLLHAGEPVKVDTLAAHLWPGQDGDTWRGTLHSLVSRIRAMLVRLGMPEALELVRPADSYRLRVDPLSVDLHEFRSLVARARTELHEQRHAAAVGSLRTAIELWHGDPIPDVRGGRSNVLREALADELLAARTLLADGLLRTGRREAALSVLTDLVTDHFLDETIARLWITLCTPPDARTRHGATSRSSGPSSDGRPGPSPTSTSSPS